jgi:Tol biopolymer transport system component
VSDNGTLAYLPGPLAPVATTASLALFDVGGGAKNLPIPAGSYQGPRVSPDGRRIAFVTDDGRDVDVWVFDLDSDRTPRRLTFAGRNRSVAWTADSRRVAYRSDRAGSMGIYWQAGDGSGTAEALTTPEKGTIDIPLSFSPDGAWLLFDRVVGGRTTLLTLSLRDRRIAPFGVESSQWTGALFSPDGKWVAYATREHGRSNQLFVSPFPATGAKYLVSSANEDAHHPVWSPDGKVLYYTPGPGNRATRVPVTFSPAPAFGTPSAFERPFTNLASSSDRGYDMMPDGRRFLSVTDPLLAAGGLGSMTVVLNWFEELKARVPVGR